MSGRLLIGLYLLASAAELAQSFGYPSLAFLARKPPQFSAAALPRGPAARPCRADRPRCTQTFMQLKFYEGRSIKVNWDRPQARGNFGNVYFGTVDGQQCVVKCPILDDFALKLFDTERAVNIKLNKVTTDASVPWAQMMGEVNIPEQIRMPEQVARIGIVWQKEGDGQTLEDYLQNNKDLYRALDVHPEKKGATVRAELCRAVMGNLLVALLQMQQKGIMHRDIKPSNTLVVPDDPAHKIKIIDFGSSCDWHDPFKMGLGDATNDPMYAPPEQTLSLAGPGKFDVFSVGMTGLRVLIPSFTRGGVTPDWPGGRFQRFAEDEFKRVRFDIRLYLSQAAEYADERQLASECREILEDEELVGLIDLLANMLTRNVILRPSVQKALDGIGGRFSQQGKEELRETEKAEAEVKAKVAKSSKEESERERQDERSREQADREEQKRKEAGASKAANAANQFMLLQKKQGGSVGVQGLIVNPFGSGNVGGRSDKDIANVVPDDWKEGVDYFRSPKLTFTKGEIVVAFRSDGSRRFGKIIQDYGDSTYDILVDRSGGEGEGQFRTDRGSNIGKIETGRSLQEEEEASRQNIARSQRAARKAVVARAKVGDAIPPEWTINVDVAFSPTSFFKVRETVVVARVDGTLRFGAVSKINGDGTLEVQVDGTAKRIFFVGSLGKILI